MAGEELNGLGFKFCEKFLGPFSIGPAAGLSNSAKGTWVVPWEGGSFWGYQPAASPAKDAGFAAGYTL